MKYLQWIKGVNVIRALVLFAFVSCYLTACQTQEEIKRQKYITEGALLYQNNCSNCHQKDGKGLESLYPPLNKSDYLKKDKAAVICLIRYGQQGEIVVNGKKYNRPMPAQTQLSDLEIAEITTYIYSMWADDETLTDQKTVTTTLASCKK